MNDERAPETMSVELHIERLILDGPALGPGQGERLRAAVAAELGRLLRRGGLDPALAAGGAYAHRRGGSVRLGPASGGTELGRGIARAAWRGLSSSAERTKP